MERTLAAQVREVHHCSIPTTTSMGICMFFSYVDQIRLNIAGTPGSLILPVATTINCLAWTSYGALKEKRDWPLICSNGLGVLFAVTTAITAVAC